VLVGGMDMSNGAGGGMQQAPTMQHGGMLMPTSAPWGGSLDQFAEQFMPKPGATQPPFQESSTMETSRKVRAAVTPLICGLPGRRP
jgi:hypothetical protein